MIRILEMGSSALLASLMRLHVPSENDIMQIVSCSFSVKKNDDNADGLDADFHSISPFPRSD